jgi:cobalamin biosynthesis protein CobD/CbiB
VTSTSDSATTPKRSEASLGELFSEMTSELSTLFRQEVQLAKAEAKEDARRATRAGAKLAVAGVAALLAAVMLSFCVAWLLDQAINRALAFLIVGVIWAGVALALFLSGRQNLKDVEGLPTTRATIKEDVEWAKAQKS